MDGRIAWKAELSFAVTIGLGAQGWTKLIVSNNASVYLLEAECWMWYFRAS